MSRKYKIVLSNEAHEDLEDIITYITKELKEPNVARNLHSKIVGEIKKLSFMPERFEMVSDIHLKAQQIRRICVGNYIIPYIVSESDNIVYIIRVLYARRDWKNLL